MIILLAYNESGVHVNGIIRQLQSEGYTTGDIKNAITYQASEGHIYSTIDEEHYQYAH